MRRDGLRAALVGFAASVVVAFAAVSWYAVHRQAIADHRADAQRKAICAILANIPGKVPTEIAHARQVFARPHHPADCRPLPGATPRPSVIRVVINGHPGTIVVNPPPSPRTASPRPSRTPQPRPSRTPTPSPTPSPSRSPAPSPSPTCLILPVRCPI